MIVNQHALHLEIRLLALLPLAELYKRVLQTVPRPLVSDHFARQNGPEARKYKVEVLVACDGVELAHEEDVFRGRDFRKRQVTDHLQSQCLGAGFALATQLFDGGLVGVDVEDLVVGDADCGELCGGGDGGCGGLDEAVRVWDVGFVEDDGVADADVLEGTAVVGVDESGVDLFEDVEAFDYAAEDGGFAVEVF